MSNANTIHVVGNLVDDPTLRYTTTERAVANLRLGVNERVNVNGEWKDRTTFLNVVVWNKQAENVALSLSKGDRIMVSGALRSREHNPSPGVRTWYTELIADEVGVALRFATVEEIERNERKTPAMAGTAPQGDGPMYGDDEPF